MVNQGLYCRVHQVELHWIFGGTNLQVLLDKRQATLLREIGCHIHPRTEIHGDCWATYNEIPSIPVIPPCIHRTVNNQNDSVHPAAQTNRTGPHERRSYFDEFDWRMESEIRNEEAFGSTCILLDGKSCRWIIA